VAFKGLWWDTVEYHGSTITKLADCGGSLRKKIRLASIDGLFPNPPPPYIPKIFADVFYISLVIANFVPHFVAMATEVGRGII